MESVESGVVTCSTRIDVYDSTQPPPSASAQMRWTLHQSLVENPEIQVGTAPSLAVAAMPPFSDTATVNMLTSPSTVAPTEDSSDDDSSLFCATSSTRSSSRSSFPTTASSSAEEKPEILDGAAGQGEGEPQYFIVSGELAPVSNTPSAPPAVLLVPPPSARNASYASSSSASSSSSSLKSSLSCSQQQKPLEQLSYPNLDSLASSGSSPRQRESGTAQHLLNTPPPLYTHTCRLRALEEHDTSWKRKSTSASVQMQLRSRIVQPRPVSHYMLEETLRSFMDHELTQVLRQRGITHSEQSGSSSSLRTSPSSSSSSSSSQSSLSPSSLLSSPPSTPIPGRSREDYLGSASSSASSLPCSHIHNGYPPHTHTPANPSPLRRSSSGRSTSSTATTRPPTRSLTITASPTVPPTPKSTKSSTTSTVSSRGSIGGNTAPLARISRFFRSRNSTK